MNVDHYWRDFISLDLDIFNQKPSKITPLSFLDAFKMGSISCPSLEVIYPLPNYTSLPILHLAVPPLKRNFISGPKSLQA